MHALQQLLVAGVHPGQAVLLHRLRPRCLAQACGTGRVCQQARQRLRQGWRIALRITDSPQSTPITRPKPRQASQAPTAELNENCEGMGSA